MPHDKHGTEVRTGDIVTVTMRVVNVYRGDEYCNLSLETVEPMYPTTNKSGLTLNTRQVEFDERPVTMPRATATLTPPVPETHGDG